MVFPAKNEPTPEKVALGKALFFDKNLSLDSSIACTTCHLPELAFTDGHVVSPGIYGRLGKRNTPSLLNAGYLDLVNKDGGVKRLDLQALVPIEDENEMGISILSLSDRLSQNSAYQKLSQEAYGENISPKTISHALASFVRTLLSTDTPYDNYLAGDSSALPPSAKRGLALFESNELNCRACHGGFNFTENAFENNGLHENYKDLGRALITLDSLDHGKFRVPSLRNVTITAPYMHDGSLGTLEQVIDHYEQVGQEPRRGQSKKIKPFALSTQQRDDLLAFLHALTDNIYAAEVP
ncbi:MAG: c-type cytochrome [Saprospiraceae bacterium]|nr:c-type cytochrome [Saprospiraceae bacterium]